MGSEKVCGTQDWGFQLRLREWSLGRLAKLSTWLLFRAALPCHVSVFLGDCTKVCFPAFQALALARGATLPRYYLSEGVALSGAGGRDDTDWLFL